MIKIIKGVYGFMSENGIVRPKTSEDEPFSLPVEQEARLVDLGVAEYVHTEDVGAPIGFDETPPELPDGVTGIPEYNTGMKADELRAIAKDMGLTFKVGTTKAEMVEAMDKFLEENVVDGVDAEDVDLPDFDPTEAVE